MLLFLCNAFLCAVKHIRETMSSTLKNRFLEASVKQIREIKRGLYSSLPQHLRAIDL